MEFIKIAGTVKESIVDGPGIRYTIFTQGCPHHCEGCHNPETHDPNSGNLVSINQLAQEILSNPLLKGVTISGGEPFMQAKQVTHLIDKLKHTNLDFILYTGFEYEYLYEHASEQNGFLDLLNRTDILIDGKFDITKKDAFLDFRGSSNQRAIDVADSLVTNEIKLHLFC